MRAARIGETWKHLDCPPRVPRGSSWAAKVSAEDVCRIRCGDGTTLDLSAEEWAEKLGVHASTVWAVFRGDSRSHIVCPCETEGGDYY
jgi:hypothetical protein